VCLFLQGCCFLGAVICLFGLGFFLISNSRRVSAEGLPIFLPLGWWLQLLPSGFSACTQEHFGPVLSDADVDLGGEVDSDVGECYNCGELQALGDFLSCQCLCCGGKVVNLYVYALAERDAQEAELMEEYASGIALHDVQAAHAEECMHQFHLRARLYASKYVDKGFDNKHVTSRDSEIVDAEQASQVYEVVPAHVDGVLITRRLTLSEAGLTSENSSNVNGDGPCVIEDGAEYAYTSDEACDEAVAMQEAECEKMLSLHT
jgi:hypothetical protein